MFKSLSGFGQPFHFGKYHHSLSQKGSGYSADDDDDVSTSSDGRKRSRMASFYLSPSQASTTRVASLKKSIDHEITEFEFEFCLDSDGFIKNKDYRIPNYQLKSRDEPKTTDLDEYYTDYDEDFEEDTMDVEDIPEDADFEWCWDEEGRLRIDEIEKEESYNIIEKEDEEQALPDQVLNGVQLEECEKVSLEMAETELSVSSGKVEQIIMVQKKMSGKLAEISNDKYVVMRGDEQLKSGDSFKNSVDNPMTDLLPSTADRSKSLDETECQSQTESAAAGQPSDQLTSSSRRAQKRVAQITPPPTNSEVAKKDEEGLNKNNENNSNFRSNIIPPKASKSEAKTSKIASMFEKQRETNNSGTNINLLPRNKSSSNVLGSSAQNKPKTLDIKPKQAVAPVKTQTIEVFEYDPMLGYCTVKRKTVPINDVPEQTQSPSKSANLSFLQSDPQQESEINAFSGEDDGKATAEQETSEIASHKENSIEESATEQENPSSSGTSSKENRVPNNQNKDTSETPLIPLSSMSKYDIPFLNNILGQKPIPEPPKSKPPKLPKSVDSNLPMPRVNQSTPSVTPSASSSQLLKKDSSPKIEIKEPEESINVNITVTKPRDQKEDVGQSKSEASKKSSKVRCHKYKVDFPEKYLEGFQLNLKFLTFFLGLLRAYN